VKLDLLPALPQAWPRGSIRGILARGQIRIDRLEWDKPAGRILLELTSKINQTVAVRLPNSKNIKSIRVTRGAAEVKESARGANCRELTLPARETVATELTFLTDPGLPTETSHRNCQTETKTSVWRLCRQGSGFDYCLSKFQNCVILANRVTDCCQKRAMTGPMTCLRRIQPRTKRGAF